MKQFLRELLCIAPAFIKNIIDQNKPADQGFNQYGKKSTIILVGGYSPSVNSFASSHVRKGLEKLDFNVFVFNPGSNTNKKISFTAKKLKSFIKEVQNRAHINKVSIVAHSMGGLISLYCLEKLGQEKTINNIIAVGSPFNGTRTAYFALHAKAAREMLPNSKFLLELAKNLQYTDRVISVRAKRDQIIKPKSSPILEGAKNVEVDVVGHSILMQSDKVLDIIKKELK